MYQRLGTASCAVGNLAQPHPLSNWTWNNLFDNAHALVEYHSICMDSWKSNNLELTHARKSQSIRFNLSYVVVALATCWPYSFAFIEDRLEVLFLIAFPSHQCRITVPQYMEHNWLEFSVTLYIFMLSK